MKGTMGMKKKVFRVVGIAALCVVGVAVAYAAIGLALSLIPVNGNAEPGGDVVVYLINNGVHADIVVPTKAERIDSRYSGSTGRPTVFASAGFLV